MNGGVIMKAGTVTVNGAQIYFEVRGSGPSVLLVSGAMGDAAYYTKIAELLSNEFTVATYDRRGNSRSTPPAGWSVTSMDEQADDAAALLAALDLAPAVIFGNSAGALIALHMLVHNQHSVRGAIVHEAPLIASVPSGQEFTKHFKERLQQAGPKGAADLLAREMFGPGAFESLDPQARIRMLDNSLHFFSVERQVFFSFIPDTGKIVDLNASVLVAVSEESVTDPQIRFFYEASAWLAERLGTELYKLPGTHGGYLNLPKEFARALRPLLRKLS
jgi:pimeloyl-ACP methyl ester carboxylesterase